MKKQCAIIVLDFLDSYFRNTRPPLCLMCGGILSIKRHSLSIITFHRMFPQREPQREFVYATMYAHAIINIVCYSVSFILLLLYGVLTLSGMEAFTVSFLFASSRVVYNSLTSSFFTQLYVDGLMKLVAICRGQEYRNI